MGSDDLITTESFDEWKAQAVEQGLISGDDPLTIFQEMEAIGHGGTADIFRAVDSRSGDEVAVKIFKQSKDKKNSDEWKDMAREILFMNDCKSPYILECYGSYVHEDNVWLALTYCAGSIYDILDVFKSPFREDEIKAVCYNVLKGLVYLNEHKKVHRDIKCGNLLITEDAKLKLADFGASIDFKENEQKTNSFIGSPYWMAPEVIMAMENGTYSFQVDVWSLGITLIEMAETKPPLFAMHAMSALFHIPQRDPPQLQTPENWSAAFSDFLAKCLVHEPAQRSTPSGLLEHEFLAGMETAGPPILAKLLKRSKEAVEAKEELDLSGLESVLHPGSVKEVIAEEPEEEAAASAAPPAAAAPSPVPVPAAESAQPAAPAPATGLAAPVAAGPTATPATGSQAPPSPRRSPHALRRRQESQGFVRTRTIKLPSQVLREKMEAGGQEKALLKAQMKELRKSRRKQEDALKSLRKKHQAEFESVERTQAVQLDVMKKNHETTESNKIREDRQEADKLTRAQGMERKREEEEIKKIHSRRHKDHKASIKQKLADLKKERKRLVKEGGEPEKDLKRKEKDQGEALETQMTATFESDQARYYNTRMEALRARQEITQEKLKFEALQSTLELQKGHVSERTGLVTRHKTVETHPIQREHVLQVHELQVEHQAKRHTIEIHQLTTNHEHARTNMQKRQLEQSKKYQHKLKKLTVADANVQAIYRRNTGASKEFSAQGTAGKKMARQLEKQTKTDLKMAKKEHVQEATIKFNKSQLAELDQLKRQQAEELSQLQGYLKRQKALTAQVHQDEISLLEKTISSEVAAAIKFREAELEVFVSGMETALTTGVLRLESFSTDRQAVLEAWAKLRVEMPDDS